MGISLRCICSALCAAMGAKGKFGPLPNETPHSRNSVLRKQREHGLNLYILSRGAPRRSRAPVHIISRFQSSKDTTCTPRSRNREMIASRSGSSRASSPAAIGHHVLDHVADPPLCEPISPCGPVRAQPTTYSFGTTARLTASTTRPSSLAMIRAFSS